MNRISIDIAVWEVGGFMKARPWPEDRWEPRFGEWRVDMPHGYYTLELSLQEEPGFKPATILDSTITRVYPDGYPDGLKEWLEIKTPIGRFIHLPVAWKDCLIWIRVQRTGDLRKLPSLPESIPCPTCGRHDPPQRDYGWYCPWSPTCRCVYTVDYGSCDLCGMPEERK